MKNRTACRHSGIHLYSRSGVALLMVLSLVVLLTIVILALLSRSASNGLISGASANFTKTDIYGHGAIDQVIGDLRQEIADGSTVASVTPASGGLPSIASPYPAYTNPTTGMVSYLYRPSSVAAAAPALSGPGGYGSPSDPTSAWNTKFLNLLKESVSGELFYNATIGPNSPGRAAPISTSSQSENGRSIQIARWNEHLLLPKQFVTFTGGNGAPLVIKEDSPTTDTTPNATFVPPDWILTAVDGSNPTAFNAATMSDPKQPGYVVGRYAFAIYNEGGLLDANVAGSPNGSGGPASTYPPTQLSASAQANGGPSQQIIWSRKGPESFADLTVLPGIAQASIPQNVVNALIGWRNAATAQASPFPTTLFTSSGIDSYFSYILGSPARFLTVGNLNGTSDNMFTSRQQLISFLQDVANGNTSDQAYLQDAMMYLGTFTRSLNQPSYWPDPKRPTVRLAPPSIPIPADHILVGNNAYQKDNEYNPPFKSIRVASSFVRPAGGQNDPAVNPDGTTAIVGEPLVKKRFALSRLIWLTYKGPSAAISQADPLYQYYLQYMPAPQLSQLWNEGTAANIKNYFGLTWTASSGISYWLYNGHASTNATGGITLSKLDQVAAQNREPDFFELLQAAMSCGSLGTVLPQAIHNNSGNDLLYCSPWQQQRDSQVGVQVLQIGANMINQVSPANFPTHIVFNNGTYTYSIWGSTDLPYLSDCGNVALVVADANPPAPGLAGDTLILNPGSTGTPTQSGVGVALAVPVVWNPYASSNIPTKLNFVPTKLRIIISSFCLEVPSVSATTLKQAFSATGTTAFTDEVPWFNLGTFDPLSGTLIYPSSGVKNNALYFKYDSTLYREPTALMLEGTPADVKIDAQNTIEFNGFNIAFNSTTSSTPALPPSPPGPGWTNGIPELPTPPLTKPTNFFVGFLLGTYPLRQSITTTSPSGIKTTTTNPISQVQEVNTTFPNAPYPGMTFSLEYQSNETGGAWIPYQQYDRAPANQAYSVPYTNTNGGTFQTESIMSSWPNQGTGTGLDKWNTSSAYDPRGSGRFGIAFEQSFRPFIDITQPTIETFLYSVGTYFNASAKNNPTSMPLGELTQNLISDPDATSPGIELPVGYFADPDGVVRRAMGGYASAVSTIGLPMATVAGNPINASNRPIILHRPFRSVAELGYVFSDTPWKNIDFFSPESGDGALLDTFCINEDYRPDAVSAGQVDLNTRQAPVIQALLAGAYRDEEKSVTPLPAGTRADLSNGEAIQLSQALVARTTSTALGKGPLSNVADLVGRYTKGFTNDNGQPYDGFTTDLGAKYTGGTSSVNSIVQRLRETTMRALSDAGQAGTWNLLIDLIAQGGRYPSQARSFADFIVEGERHYWVHVAIDRQTGQVIDENIEVVNE